MKFKGKPRSKEGSTDSISWISSRVRLQRDGKRGNREVATAEKKDMMLVVVVVRVSCPGNSEEKKKQKKNNPRPHSLNVKCLNILLKLLDLSPTHNRKDIRNLVEDIRECDSRRGGNTILAADSLED